MALEKIFYWFCCQYPLIIYLAWYRDGKGDPEAVDNLASFITEQFIPSLKVLSVHGGCCVTAKVISLDR